ncbi:MAG: multiheme c-type cytochrome [Planctomycetota bacterium]
MNLIGRIVAAVLLLAAVGTVVTLAGGGAEDGVGEGTEVTAAGGGGVRWQSSAQCIECHSEVAEEWQGSHHQISYSNPRVRELSNDFRNKECQSCHLPQPVAATGYGQRTLPRQSRFDEGVGCISCHLGTNGQILARNSRPDVACAPVADDSFLDSKMCSSCHNQHGTSDQFFASSWAEDGGSCNDCHMPETQRSHGGMGRGHVFHGCHDLESLQSAARFDVKRDGDEIVIEVENNGAGHNFPTEERHRAVDIMVRVQDAEGGFTEWDRLWRFRQLYRDETSDDPPLPAGGSTQLPSGETHVERLPIAAGVKRVEVRLWYRLNPFSVDGDEDSTLLFERAVDL